MRRNPTLSNIIVLAIIFLIIYELVDSFRNANILGIVLSLASLVAFFITMRLVWKLMKSKAMDDGEEEESQGNSSHY